MTRIKLFTLLAGIAIGGTFASAATGPDRDGDLEHVLANRVEQRTVSCVNLRDLGGNRTVGDAIVFGDHQRRIYVNHPPAGCPELGTDRALTFRTTMTQLCRGDIVTVVDLSSRSMAGSCSLGDFTPYDRPTR